MIEPSTTQPERNMKTPHKHAKIIKAWADGASIQVQHGLLWLDIDQPMWNDDFYRIKPEPRPDVVQFHRIEINRDGYEITDFQSRMDNLKLTFDGETGKLKAAEVLK